MQIHDTDLLQILMLVVLLVVHPNLISSVGAMDLEACAL